MFKFQKMIAMNRVTEIYAVILFSLTGWNKKQVLELSSGILAASVSIGSLTHVCQQLPKSLINEMMTFIRLWKQSVSCGFKTGLQSLFLRKKEPECSVFPFFDADYHFSLYKNVVLLPATSEKFLCSSLHCVSVGWWSAVFTWRKIII